MPSPYAPPRTGLRFLPGATPPRPPGGVSSVAPAEQAGLESIGSTRTVTPEGRTSFETQFGITPERELAAREAANQAAEARRTASIQSLLSETAGPRAVPQVSYDQAGAEAARQAAFARAKDQAGLVARQSLDALRGELSSRGLGAGSTEEAARTGLAIGGAAGTLGEVSREQAIQDAARAGEVADLLYQGGITQRGQDIGQQQQRLSSLLALYGSGPVY